MLTVTTWLWRIPGKPPLFNAGDVNRLRAALERHLRLPHELVCVTDDPSGLDPRVRPVAISGRYRRTPRCRRRMQVFSREFAERRLGPRILSMDLDVVITDDITPLVDRPEPLVCWRVGYAGVFSGSFLLHSAGVLDDLWRAFQADPDGLPLKAPGRVPSDQAMLNRHLRGRLVPHWTEADGFVSYFGAGYEHLQHHGVGPDAPALPAGARIVVLGSADKAVLDEGRFPWVREHWLSLPSLPAEGAA